MIYAIDFDGTLCTNNYPDIGEPIEVAINFVKALKEQGEELILWTCRSGELLDRAVEWCDKHGLKFDKINENLDWTIKKFGGDTRKIFADFYYDDKNI